VSERKKIATYKQSLVRDHEQSHLDLVVQGKIVFFSSMRVRARARVYVCVREGLGIKYEDVFVVIITRVHAPADTRV